MKLASLFHHPTSLPASIEPTLNTISFTFRHGRRQRRWPVCCSHLIYRGQSIAIPSVPYNSGVLDNTCGECDNALGKRILSQSVKYDCVRGSRAGGGRVSTIGNVYFCSLSSLLRAIEYCDRSRFVAMLFCICACRPRIA